MTRSSQNPRPADSSENLDPFLGTDSGQMTLPDASGPVTLEYGTPDTCYENWPSPDAILADVTGVSAATQSVSDACRVLQPHFETWMQSSAPGTTLWLITPTGDWPSIHSEAESAGWDHRTTLTWRKDCGDVPCTQDDIDEVTVTCARYVRPPVFEHVRDHPPTPRTCSIQSWIQSEWERSEVSRSLIEDRIPEFPIAEYLTGESELKLPFSVFIELRDCISEYGKQNIIPYFWTPLEIDEWTEQTWDDIHPVFEADATLTTLWTDVSPSPENRLDELNLGDSPTLPTQTTIETWRKLLKLTTTSDDLVWVPFAGAGDACIASKEMGRECCGAVAGRDAYRVSQSRLEDAVFGRGIGNTQVSFTDF